MKNADNVEMYASVVIHTITIPDLDVVSVLIIVLSFNLLDISTIVH